MECEIYVQTGSDIRHDQWVARTFSLEGVVRDSLSVSDVNDLSQLTTVEWMKHGSFRWCWSTRAHVVCEHMGCKRIVQSQPEVLGYTEMSDPERPQLQVSFSVPHRAVSQMLIYHFYRQQGAIRCISSRKWLGLLMKSTSSSAFQCLLEGVAASCLSDYGNRCAYDYTECVRFYRTNPCVWRSVITG